MVGRRPVALCGGKSELRFYNNPRPPGPLPPLANERACDRSHSRIHSIRPCTGVEEKKKKGRSSPSSLVHRVVTIDMDLRSAQAPPAESVRVMSGDAFSPPYAAESVRSQAKEYTSLTPKSPIASPSEDWTDAEWAQSRRPAMSISNILNEPPSSSTHDSVIQAPIVKSTSAYESSAGSLSGSEVSNSAAASSPSPSPSPSDRKSVV